MEVSLLLIILFEVLLLLKETSGDDTCIIGGRSQYCFNGCCTIGDQNFCCLSTYAIVGIVFGCIGAVCSIASLIFCCIQQKKRSGQVMAQPARVVVVSSQNNSSMMSPDYSSIKPLPPGYPTYYNPNSQSGQLPYGANPAPPPYSYSSPATNPFKAAATTENNAYNSQYRS